MEGITKYRVEALINGSVSIVPNPLKMRFNDEKTPSLDVWVSYLTTDGKKHPFVLTDKKILFEVVTPGGAAGILSSEENVCFEIVNHNQGHFLFTFPPECKDAVGSSKLAYFRFVDGESIFSSGNFTYTVTKDVYSVTDKELKAPANFNKELADLRTEFERVRLFMDEAFRKASESLGIAIEAKDGLAMKQDCVPTAKDNNIAVWKDGSTQDSGISIADISGGTGEEKTLYMIDYEFRHDLDEYPDVTVIEFEGGGTNGRKLPDAIGFDFEYGCGIGPCGETPCGGGGIGDLRSTVEYPDSNSVVVFTEKNYGTIQNVTKTNEKEYVVTFVDGTLFLMVVIASCQCEADDGLSSANFYINADGELILMLDEK